MTLGNLHLSQEVPEDEVLELANEVRVRSALELLEALKEMNSETFEHHVSEHHNDFAEWILEQYYDEDLFKKMLLIKTKEKLVKLLESELKKELRMFTKNKKKERLSSKIRPPKKRNEVLKLLGGLDG